MAAFEELGIYPDLIGVADEQGWLFPTDIQSEVIPAILGGTDVLAAAVTGSGKTGAFCLPAIQVIHEILRGKVRLDVEVNQEKFVWNSQDKDTMVTVSQNGEMIMCNEQNWRGIRANNGILSGKYCYEIKVVGDGLVRVGWSHRTSKLELGVDVGGFGFGGTGKKSWNRRFEDYGEGFKKGDTITCGINRQDKTQEIRFWKNGIDLGPAFVIGPSLGNSEMYPAICGKNFIVEAKLFNLTFVPSNYVPVGEALPTDLQQIGPNCKLAVRETLCAIFEPTRELAKQTFDVLSLFASAMKNPSVSIGLCIGGQPADRSITYQDQSIIVGTFQKAFLSLKNKMQSLRIVILDEADELFKQDEDGTLKRFMKTLSSSRKVQLCYFSATLHDVNAISEIEALSPKAQCIDQKGKIAIPETVYVCFIMITPEITKNYPQDAPTDGVHKFTTGITDINSQKSKKTKPYILKCLIDHFKMESCLVFCRTNLDCQILLEFLVKQGRGSNFTDVKETGIENPYSCAILAGKMSTLERSKNLEAFKSGNVRILICTDVAARGIDITALPFVVNMTLPEDPLQFFHRIGRVGRADHLGLAISLVSTVPERVWYHRCPSRGVNCRNVEVVEKGGCTVFLEEMNISQKIESLIDSKITQMDANTFHAEGIKHSDDHGYAVYGKLQDDDSTAILDEALTLNAISEKVQKVELSLQDVYLKELLNRF